MAPPATFSMPVEDALPVYREVEKRLVEEAVVAKLFVVVALVEVEFTAVKFWSVELPFTKRFARVASPFKKAMPVLNTVEKRLVLEAVVLNELVVVAAVPVASSKENVAKNGLEDAESFAPKVVEVETTNPLLPSGGKIN